VVGIWLLDELVTGSICELEVVTSVNCTWVVPEVSLRLTLGLFGVVTGILRLRYASARALVELFASVRPCSVAVSFNFRFLDVTSGKGGGCERDPSVNLGLLLGLELSPSGTLSPSVEILSLLLAQNSLLI
jgi:hypothetical protein